MKKLLIAMVLLIVPINAHAGAIRLAGCGLKAAGKGIGKGAAAVGKVSLGALVVGTYEGGKFVAVNAAKGGKKVGKAAWKVIY